MRLLQNQVIILDFGQAIMIRRIAGIAGIQGAALPKRRRTISVRGIGHQPKYRCRLTEAIVIQRVRSVRTVWIVVIISSIHRRWRMLLSVI